MIQEDKSRALYSFTCDKDRLHYSNWDSAENTIAGKLNVIASLVIKTAYIIVTVKQLNFSPTREYYRFTTSFTQSSSSASAMFQRSCRCRCYRKENIVTFLTLVVIVGACYVIVTSRIPDGQIKDYLSMPLPAYRHSHKLLANPQDDTRNERENAPHLLDSAQACIHPRLELSDPVMMRLVWRQGRPSCNGMQPDWVIVDNGTLKFDTSVTRNYDVFNCEYYPLIREPGDNFITFGDPVRIEYSGIPMTSNFFKVKCFSNTRVARYENIQAGIFNNETLRERLKTAKPPANGLGMSVAMLVFDSMSRMSWLRRMPKTRDYMVKRLGAIELKGYNIVGDATTAAMFPILTGKHEVELPEARKHFSGSKHLDDFPWIWKQFQKNGYITSWADANIDIGPFNLRLQGFKHQPTDFYMRPFYLAAVPTYRRFLTFCHGSELQHMVWFNWLRDIFYMYKHEPKFLVHFYSPLSHEGNNYITMADEDLKNFLENLENGGYLNNTLLLVMGDHGSRFDDVRRTLSGKLEERLPYVSLRFPPWFEKKYPSLVKNVKTNVNRLTTPFDLHETFKDILRFDGAGLGDVMNRGISLFKEIPKSRTCHHADVAPHWCACLAWKEVNHDDPDAKRALAAAVDAINNFTEPYRSDCAKLSVGDVTTVTKLLVSDDVLRFNQTTGDRGLEPIMSDNSVKNERAIYQLTFFTEPGHGEFELTLEHLLYMDTMSVNPKAISRINKYGKNPACILDKNRELRQYCYCNSNLSGK
ncbi:uncharacterized protein LOC131931793 [Physella acuta]|uniref:uncharacterized protein LOC131931793 n=1 Tax=Physella acuta TaxID=109671 RepID=UPI0027DB6A23|nr:uncharacterized protein LOC131931793 [Physella acuta]